MHVHKIEMFVSARSDAKWKAALMCLARCGNGDESFFYCSHRERPAIYTAARYLNLDVRTTTEGERVKVTCVHETHD